MDRIGAPLLVTNDEALLADLVRLAAAAGVVPDNARDVTSALQWWATAAVVVVGADLAPELACGQPLRRPHVHLVGTAPLPDSLYRSALGCGAETVWSLPQAEAWLVELLTDTGDGRAGTGATIGVIGGAGGAGATVFAAALAQTVAAGLPTVVLDVDPLGAGIDRVLGLDAVGGTRWDDLADASGRLSARSLREALPRRGDLSVLTWPTDHVTHLPAVAVREALSAGQRGFSVVVLDLPRRRDSITDELIARCDHVLLVSTATVPAVAAASRLARQLPQHSTHLILRGSRVVAAEVERLLGLRMLATMSDQRGLDEAINLGAGPLRTRRGPLARAARRVAREVVSGFDR